MHDARLQSLLPRVQHTLSTAYTQQSQAQRQQQQQSQFSQLPSRSGGSSVSSSGRLARFDVSPMGSKRSSDSQGALSSGRPSPSGPKSPGPKSPGVAASGPSSSPITAPDAAASRPPSSSTPSAPDAAASRPTSSAAPTAPDTVASRPTSSAAPSALDAAANKPLSSSAPTAPDAAANRPPSSSAPAQQAAPVTGPSAHAQSAHAQSQKEAPTVRLQQQTKQPIPQNTLQQQQQQQQTPPPPPPQTHTPESQSQQRQAQHRPVFGGVYVRDGCVEMTLDLLSFESPTSLPSICQSSCPSIPTAPVASPSNGLSCCAAQIVGQGECSGIDPVARSARAVYTRQIRLRVLLRSHYTYVGLARTIYTVRSRSLRDHTFKKLIKITILVREGVWGLFLSSRALREGPAGNYFLSSRAPL